MTIQDIEEILPDIYRIPVPLAGNPLKELNSYLIRGEKSLLVDTGFATEACRAAVEEGLGLLGVSMEHTDILLTHFHADHSGNAPALIRPGNRVYLGAVDCKYLKRGRRAAGSHELHEIQKINLLRHGVEPGLVDEMLAITPSRKLASQLAFDDYTPLKEGDRITVGAYTLRGIDTPGHTPGQMCFEIEGTGAMILGDHVLFDISPNITNWADVEDSLGNYLASLDKIDRYEVTIPMPGHRKPGDFHGRIAALKVHHAKRLEECLSIIRRLDHARLYDIAGNMTWRIRADSWQTFPAPQRWFALGECMAHLDHLRLHGKIARMEDELGYWYEVL